MAAPRSAVKWIRDFSKSHYRKDVKCAICDTPENLELHHYSSVSLLVHSYAEENNLDFSNKEVILEHREAFLDKHWQEMVEDTVTLCKKHHLLLHSVYGEVPDLSTASKQPRWVELQRRKNTGEELIIDHSLTKYCTQSKNLLDFIVKGR